MRKMNTAHKKIVVGFFLFMQLIIVLAVAVNASFSLRKSQNIVPSSQVEITYDDSLHLPVDTEVPSDQHVLAKEYH